jgi:alpha-tubulin suppressor-like RCC1 family protein
MRHARRPRWLRRAARPAAGGIVFLLAACGDPFLPDPIRHYADVATAGSHSCAVTEWGDAYCWGNGTDGQLGHKLKENSALPVLVTGDLIFKSVTAGDTHSCGTTVEGRGFCWGWNAFYQLGTAGIIAEAVPNVVPSDVRFTHISAGAFHNCALGIDQRVYCWGYNRWGQVGNGSTESVITATPVSADFRAVAVSSGGYHSCALATDGDVWCWGANDFGQLGTGSSALFVAVPTLIRTPLLFASISAGRTHSCGVSIFGEAYCWGSNAHGELGDGVPFRPGLAGPPTPVLVKFITDVVSVSAGAEKSCAVTRGGLGWCWGRNESGQLGVGSVTDMSVPTPLYLFPVHLHSNDLLRFDRISAAGETHACGVAERSVFCWGTGRSGALGGHGAFATQPQRVRN